jgi:Mlc titration factor MtfA (ptsG expression regulator)
MLDNTELVGAAIDAYGASAVAEFFINVGTSIAALYEETPMDANAVTAIQEGTSE